MITLDTIHKSLEIVLAGAITTTQLPWTVTYGEVSTADFSLSSVANGNGTTNGGTAVPVVAAPVATFFRQIKYLSAFNADTVPATVTIRLNDNGTTRVIWRGILAVGYTVTFTDVHGFVVTDTNGAIVQSTPQLVLASSQSNPADPVGTTDLTGKMMGLAGALTPVGTSGQMLVTITGTILNASGIVDGAKVRIRYGTGSAPANGDAPTGTAVGGFSQYVSSTTAEKVPFALTALVTGLTQGTAYWLDVALAALTGGTAQITDVSISAIER